jgi:hypothetical protein
VRIRTRSSLAVQSGQFALFDVQPAFRSIDYTSAARYRTLWSLHAIKLALSFRGKCTMNSPVVAANSSQTPSHANECRTEQATLYRAFDYEDDAKTAHALAAEPKAMRVFGRHGDTAN